MERRVGASAEKLATGAPETISNEARQNFEIMKHLLQSIKGDIRKRPPARSSGKKSIEREHPNMRTDGVV